MGLWNVVAAGVVAWIFGVLWYRAKATRRAEMAGGALPVTIVSPLPALVSLIVMILMAGFLRHIFFVSNLTSNVPLGLVAGAGVGAFFVGPWLWMNNLAEGRPLRLTLMDGGYATIATAIMGALLVAW